MNELPVSPQETNVRWNLVRDVAVFQAKLIVDGLRGLLLLPASLRAHYDIQTATLSTLQHYDLQSAGLFNSPTALEPQRAKTRRRL